MEADKAVEKEDVVLLAEEQVVFCFRPLSLEEDSLSSKEPEVQLEEPEVPLGIDNAVAAGTEVIQEMKKDVEGIEGIEILRRIDVVLLLSQIRICLKRKGKGMQITIRLKKTLIEIEGVI